MLSMAMKNMLMATPWTSSGAMKLGWLNGLLAVGLGHRLPGGPIYNLFELL